MSSSLSRESQRLLRALATAGARAVADPFEAGRLSVFAPRNGVSVRIAAAARAAVDALERADLVVWRGKGARATCEPTQAGLAALARADAPDGLTPFQAQHAAPAKRRPDGADGSEAWVNEAESPLAWLARRKGGDGAPFLDAAALQAGERLRADLTRAQILPRVTSNWSAAGAGGRGGAGPAEALDATVAARQRVEAALAAVGAEMAGLLIDVCGFLKGLETIEGERRWPPRSAKIVLKIALERLASHYGLSHSARGPAAAPLRGWSAPPEVVAPGL
ncbi:MAG: ATPase [Rhizobiales bacterium]|nr:ATPase [Hyphomicrobiales bacterium]